MIKTLFLSGFSLRVGPTKVRDKFSACASQMVSGWPSPLRSTTSISSEQLKWQQDELIHGATPAKG